MSEPGGSTTQSGIWYQNSVAALYLGRLCDAVVRPDSMEVVEVRVEAPTSVDDVVLTFADGHQTYMEAKERIAIGSRPWLKMWKDLDRQFREGDFRPGRDRLSLCLGESRNEHYVLKGLCERAYRSQSHDGWWRRLTEPQRVLVERIEPLLGSGLSAGAETMVFFGHLDVNIWLLEHIEQSMVPDHIPDSNRPKWSLFRLLRDRVGGEARRRGWFTSAALRKSLRTEDEVLLAVPPDAADLRESAKACGTLLKQHKHTFGDTGLSLERAVVGDIFHWALEGPDEEGIDNVAVLLDGAGMGKTVVMSDVFRMLEGAGATVLAIKADTQLTGVTDRDGLQEKLDLPDRVERVVRRLAALEKVVVLVDQIDALSLSMARDQRALGVVLETVAKLREIVGVRILFSCRAFDLSNDPSLDRVQVSRRFGLPPLSDEEISSVLVAQDFDLGSLSPAAKELLRTPLHLDLFSRILEARGSSQGTRRDGLGISTLQDLYALLWRDVVLRNTPDSPCASEREEVLRLLTEHMDRRQRTSAPRSILARPETEYLEPAAHWLASAGILVAGATEWSFLHQTFFDYCYARRFVEEGGSLSAVTLAGEQGFFERPRLVQVLSYLRGSDNSSYLSELQRLAKAEGLRIHLRLLALRWFGALRNPTDEEWLVARRMLADTSIRARMLAAMGGNPDWFERLEGGRIQDLLGREELLDVEVLPYLVSMVGIEQAKVVELVAPFWGKDARWNRRVRWVLEQIRDWRAPEAVRLFERILRETPTVDLGRVYEMDDVVRAFPRDGCRMIRLLLDRALDGYVTEAGGHPHVSGRGLFRDSPLRDLEFAKILKLASEAEPVSFVEQVLPWVERAVRLTAEPVHGGPGFRRDALSHDRRFGGAGSPGHDSLRALAVALARLAEIDPERFRREAGLLAQIPYETPQHMLCSVYQDLPESHASDALHFLLGDSQRLRLGRGERFGTRQLIRSIYPFLSKRQKDSLEEFVLSYYPTPRYRRVDGLRERDLEQMFLLEEISQENLSDVGRRRLAELRRKFPGLKASREDVTGTRIASAVGPPIPASSAEKMSDGAWLRAMQVYSGGQRHREPHRGGAYQLKDLLAAETKKNPERFHRLALSVPLDVEGYYVQAFVDGLAESGAPDDWLFDVVIRFAHRQEHDLKRIAAWALRKRADGGLSDKVLDLLEREACDPVGADEAGSSSQGLHGDYINSDRGANFETLAHALRARTGTEAGRRLWQLLEFGCKDSSPALRCGTIAELNFALYEDRDRAITLFELAMDGHPSLLDSRPVQDFLYRACFKRFSRVEPFIAAMLRTEGDAQQRGAELACIAALSPPATLGSEADLEAARRLAKEATSGAVAGRRGAARVYSHNIHEERAADCARELTLLVNDPDDGVRDTVGDAFRHLRGSQTPGLRAFVESFAASRASRTADRQFFQYLLEYGPEETEWALEVLNIVLANKHDEGPYMFAGDLVKLVLRLYTDPTADPEQRTRAMDVFDGLMERHSYQAQRALDEYDRR